MRGVITKIHPTFYEVRCDDLNEIVIVDRASVEPAGMNQNLVEQFANSNGDWAQGSHVDFTLADWTLNGRFVAESVLVSFVGR